MASSRWKRFAFFERQTLQFEKDVLEDLLPEMMEAPASIRSLKKAAMHESISLAISTAGLPASSASQPSTTATASSSSSDGLRRQQAEVDDDDPISAMWKSLTACHAVVDAAATTTTTSSSSSVQLPSQGQTILKSAAAPSSSLQSNKKSPSSSTSSSVYDGLVLAFVASQDSTNIHCFDVTVRCNPPVPASPSSSEEEDTKNTKSTSLEDRDGWRGYWNPLFSPPAVEGTVSNQTTVVSLATCRAPTSPTENSKKNPLAQHSPLHVAVLGKSTERYEVVVYEDPHLYLSCRRPLTNNDVTGTSTTTSIRSMATAQAVVYRIPYANAPSSLGTSQQSQSSSQQQQHLWNPTDHGPASVVDICPGLVAVGTQSGVVLVYAMVVVNSGSSSSPPLCHLKPFVRIPAPPTPNIQVVSVRLSLNVDRAHVFVAYHAGATVVAGDATTTATAAAASMTAAAATTTSAANSAGICCYDLPLPSGTSNQVLSAPSARHDLDGRYVGSSSLVDAYERQVTVARPDGLYSYSNTERTGVAPIDGTKLAICIIPNAVPAEKVRDVDSFGPGYALVASTDSKSGRDAVDIYDSTNKLVAFHLLLSPGHRAVQAAGVTSLPTHYPDGTVRGGRSSAAVLSSGGSLVTFTEKLTEEKIALLVQKNLYSAAIVVAYADPSYEAIDITTLYQQYAEHLYRKGDFAGAMDQYMHTIGSLESSHVIFRYLDAPKIPLLVKYLEKLRTRDLATPVHNELLRTCYLKLNDVQAAEAIAISSSRSINDASLESILTNLSTKPKDALATICSLEAPQAAEVLVIHGASLARVLPRETAGVVISLCVGTYTPTALAEASNALGAAAATTTAAAMDLNKLVNTHDHPKNIVIEPYPVHLFASAFVEHPKLLRLILAHCNRNKCSLTPSLRRSLLELTLFEWNQAKRSGDTEAEKLRHKEAIASLTDSHCRDIGDYEALVIVQLAGFEEGELLLYERLQMTPMLLERYAKDGTEKSRRQMLAMCQTDPEILADVLGHFVEIASEKLDSIEQKTGNRPDDGSEDDEAEEIMEDIQEALTLARRQGVLPPVRIARILAGEGTGQFSNERPVNKKTVPLSVALDYVGTILEESRKEASRLKDEIEEYNQLCNSMESEIDSLLRASHILPPADDSIDKRLNIDELFAKVKSDDAVLQNTEVMPEQAREAFWREMNQTEDSFETIARFFAKGVIG